VVNSAAPKTYYLGVPITEVCDEGPSKTDALGCLKCCSEVQLGYKCGSAGTECILRCGDTIRDDPEAGTLAAPNTSQEKCDDGNTISGDGCQNDCLLVEAGYECVYAGGACNKICGNGAIDNPFTSALNKGTHFSET
jgi:large repetitive protein